MPFDMPLPGRRRLVLAAALACGLVAAAMPVGAAAQAPQRTVLEALAQRNMPDLRRAMEARIKRIDGMKNADPGRIDYQYHSLVRHFPMFAKPRYRYAVRLANKPDTPPEAVLEMLESAVERGYSDVKRLRVEPAFDSLRDLPRFRDLVDAAGRPRMPDPGPVETGPTAIEDGIALVAETNTGVDRRLKVLRPLFRRSAAGDAPARVRIGEAPHFALLNAWFAEGRAAGNRDDFYDNRDHDHATLRRQPRPQVTFVEYSDIAHAARIERGLGGINLLFDRVTVGNSSTVHSGPFGRSHPRHAMTSGAGIPEKLYRQYRLHHLYVYPEHRDHDPDTGDLFPANLPYLIASQGSSSSDAPFVAAALDILAAFRPEVKEYLRENNLTMPTVQMILRRSQGFVTRDEDYLDGRAHPSAFESEHLDSMRMVNMANDLTVDRVPPVVELRVLRETKPKPGVGLMAQSVSESLFDTPAAIARVVRGVAREKRMVVSAARTKRLDDAPPSFRWVVLRGDAERIRILPRDNRASEVEIVVPWHERRPVPGRPEIATDRVDIGVFTQRNGTWSAPSFITFYYPPNQKRVYGEDGRLASIDYDAAGPADRKLDPLLVYRRPWTDVYEYDDRGRLLGWRRQGEGAIREQRYTRHGARVLETDALDRPVRARRMTYRVVPKQRRGGQFKEIEGLADGDVLVYTYAGPEDRLGTLSVDPR